jgi:4-carboxymuconolactone decarboxylase
MREKRMTSQVPPDIDPQSGSRLPLRRREDLDEAGKRAFDRASTPGKTIVGLRGPSGIHLYSPATVEAHNVMNQYLRYQCFDPKTREIAILTVAREMDSRFEWAAHEPEAVKEGVSPDVVDVIEHRKSTRGLDEAAAAIIEFGRQIFRDHKVSSQAYTRLKAVFPDNRKLVEMVMLMGNYAATAALLCAFDVQVPEGKPVLPVDG